MNSIVFTCYDTAVKINSESNKIIEYLIDMFSSYYHIDNKIEADFELSFNIGIPNKYLYIDNEKGDYSVNYIIGNNKKIDIYLPYIDDFKLSFVKRIFTTTFVKTFQKKGYTILHGACAFKENKGIIITGEAGSGKTTLLQKLLFEGYGYVANDRLAIKNDGNNVIVCGIPFSMGIKCNDIRKRINSYSSYYIEEIQKLFLENKEVPKYFCVEMKSNIPLSIIVLCAYDKSFEGLKVYKISNLDERIKNNIMIENAIPEQKYYLHSIIGTYDRICDLSNLDGIELIQGINSDKKTMNQIENSITKKRRRC